MGWMRGGVSSKRRRTKDEIGKGMGVVAAAMAEVRARIQGCPYLDMYARTAYIHKYLQAGSNSFASSWRSFMGAIMSVVFGLGLWLNAFSHDAFLFFIYALTHILLYSVQIHNESPIPF